MLDALRTWAREEGRAPRAYEWAPWAAAALGITSEQTRKWEREHDRWPSLEVAAARFGSWRQALRSAGLPTHPPLVLPLQERVGMARRLHGVCGVDEAAELVGVSCWTVYKYWNAVRCGGCGGWQVYPWARTCVDCHARGRRRARPPGAEMIDRIRAWAAETGAPPRVTDWTGDSEKWDREYPRWPSRLAVTERFGSWPAALQAAGFAPDARRWGPRPDPCCAARAGRRARPLADARRHRRTPGSVREQRARQAFRLTRARAACRRAGAGPPRMEQAGRDRRPEAVRARAGRLPTSADLRSTRGTAYPPATAVRALLGDLYSAPRACGYDGPPRRTRFDADDALRALRRFDEAHGRSPSVRRWDELGRRPSARDHPPLRILDRRACRRRAQRGAATSPMERLRDPRGDPRV